MVSYLDELLAPPSVYLPRGDVCETVYSYMQP